MAVKDSFSF
jgi:hypothetical protein